jgi:hypothetical protein
MERFAVWPAVISLLFLIPGPSAFAGGQHGFSIKVFTSPDDQFWVNSVIIEGADCRVDLLPALQAICRLRRSMPPSFFRSR